MIKVIKVTYGQGWDKWSVICAIVVKKGLFRTRKQFKVFHGIRTQWWCPKTGEFAEPEIARQLAVIWAEENPAPVKEKESVLDKFVKKDS